MRIKTLLFLAVVTLRLAIPALLMADSGSFTFSGGSFTPGSAVGQSIVLTGAVLSAPNSSFSFSCPIVTFGAGTYGTTWTCANGTYSVTSTDNSLKMAGPMTSGSMSYACSGGGRGGHITCEYSFFGTFGGAVTNHGVGQMVLGSTNMFKVVPGGISGVVGWNSLYSPIVVGDAVRPRLLGADDIIGENLVAYGGPGSGVGQFGAVSGLAQDASGRIYIADGVNNRIDRIDNLTGADWVELGSAGLGVKQFSAPLGIAVDASGKIWVADSGNNRIVRFDDMTGTNWTAFGTLGTGVNQFNAPSSIAFDQQGRIYVADKGNSRLVRFDDLTGTNWASLTEVLLPPYGYFVSSPVAVAVDAANKVDIALSNGYLLRVDDITGVNGAVARYDSALSAMSVDKAGTIYLAGSTATGLAQGTGVTGIGYYTANLGGAITQASAILARPSSSPPPPATHLTASIERYGSANVGELAPRRNVYVENTGGLPLPIGSVSAGADFLLFDNCPSTLPGGTYCQLGVQMKPTKTGAISETLSVSTGGVHPLTHTSLVGTGTIPQPVVVPLALAFDPQKTGSASGQQTVTLTNTGSGPLTISGIAASANFLETNNCPPVLTAGSGCTVLVSFYPAAVGAATGTLSISDDAVAAGATQVVSLSGTGSATAPGLTLAPESLQFPNQSLNVASIAQAVILHNGTGATVTLGNAALTAGFFGTSTCGKTLASGASCVYSVQFKPTAAGPATGTLTIPITGGTALVVGLSGTGVPASGTTLLTANPAAISFTNIIYGDNPSIQTIVTNTGGVPLGIPSIVLSADPTYSITVNTCPQILAGHAACMIEITWVPVSTTPYSTTGTLTILDSTGASLVIPVTGFVTVNGN